MNTTGRWETLPATRFFLHLCPDKSPITPWISGMAEMQLTMYGSGIEPLMILDLLATELHPVRWWMWEPKTGWFGPVAVDINPKTQRRRRRRARG
jgi:hypothetical protein